MLTSPAGATATTPTTSASPVRPSRLRGLSYLRNYTTERLSSRSDAPSLTRSTSTPNAPTVTNSPEHSQAPSSAMAAATSSTARRNEQNPSIRFIPHIEVRSSRPSLNFNTITKTLKNARGIIKVGRYTERDQGTESEDSLPVGFKSKVVSRRHCEFWFANNQWFVKDVKSSSGTFLNHVRLSSPGMESRPYPVNDGDVIQLGIDFKGGEEVIFRCVKIRIECNRGWQKALNNYNTTTHKKLLNSVGAGKTKRDSAASVNNHECSICLNPVTPCQCLFVAPCSHVWHYKCVRNLVHGPNYPNFLCPNCRFVADLEADVEPPEEDLYEDLDSPTEEKAEKSEDAEHGAQSSSSEEATGRMDEDGTAHAPTATTETDPANAPATMQSADDPSPSQSLPVPTTGIQRANSPRFISRPGTPEDDSRHAHVLPEHLLTPRNDAGPFVLDGAAGFLSGAAR